MQPFYTGSYSTQGKNRARRIEEIVIPKLEQMKPIVAKEVLETMKKERIRGDKEFLRETHTKRSIAIVRQDYFSLVYRLILRVAHAKTQRAFQGV